MFGTINLEPYFEKIQSDGWALLPFDQEQCNQLHNEVLRRETLNNLQQGSLANSLTNHALRNDFVSWINFDTQLVTEIKLIQALTDLQFALKNYFRLSLDHFELHYAKYPIGHFYKKHSDQKANDNKRLFSFVIYLNTDWQTQDGGELCGYKKKSTEEIFRIPPAIGTMIVFKSELEHEVFTTRRDRYSIAGWIRTA